MRAMWVGLLGVAAIGCGGGDGGDGGDDGGPPLDAAAAVRFELREVRVAGTLGAAPYAFTGDDVAPVFLTSDGAPTTQVAPGAWEAPAAGTPAVQFTLRGLRRIWAVPSRTVRGELVELGHADPVPAAGGAGLALAIALPEPFDAAANQIFQVHAFGADYHHDLSSGELPAPGSSSLSSTIAYVGTRITQADGLVVLRRAVPSLEITGAASIAPFDQTPGTSPVTGTLATVASDQTFTLTIDRAATEARFTALVPAMTNNFQTFWTLGIAPGGNVGVPDGVGLAAGSLAADGSRITRAYANPFAARGWPAVVTVWANASRLTAPIMGQAKQLIASVRVVAPASAPPADFAAGLPGGFALNGRPLTSDLAAAPAGPLELTFTTDHADPASPAVYTLVLFNTIGMPGADQALVEMTSTEPRFTLPEDAFLGPMRPPWYYVRVTCTRGGYTGAATGDLQTFTLPMSTATVDSPVFVRQ